MCRSTILSLSLLTASTYCTAQTPILTVVSAASYTRDAPLAPDMIVTAFSAAVPDVGQASGSTLPTTLGGYSIFIRGASGADIPASLVAIVLGQASFVIPSSLPDGTATATLRRGTETIASGTMRIARVAPGIFTANGSGEGPPAGQAVYVDRSGKQRFTDLFERLAGSATFDPAPQNIADLDEDVYLTLYGTGFRNASSSRISTTAGGLPITVQAAQAHSSFAGLDQLNLGPLPRALSGKRGMLDLEITFDAIAANRVTISPTWPPSGSWGRRAPLIEENSEMGVVGLNGKIYVIGGYPSTRNTVRTVQVYDTATDSWTLASPLPTGVNHSMPAAHNGKVYVIGGQTDAASAYINSLQEYNPSTNSWRLLSPMPTARSGGAAVLIDGKIYVAGGRPPRGSDFAVYDPATDKWTTLTDLPTQRNHLMAATFNGKLYVIGGRFEGGFTSQAADVVEIYERSTGRWTKGAPLPKPRGGLNAVLANGCIHTFGGEFATGVHPDHDVYNPITNIWTSLPNMPIPVHGVTGLHFQDGLIYLPGGGTMQGGSSGSNLHQVYRVNMYCQ